MLAPAGSELLAAAERGGLPTASEVFADRAYTADGNLAPRALPGAAAEHALRLASGLPIRALDTGAELRLRADSICVHGDKPSAVTQARGVRDALLAEGFTLCTLPENPRMHDEQPVRPRVEARLGDTRARYLCIPTTERELPQT
eukprot:scaffold106546_cov75-Phaeocystis_antarctica.AAC.1